jgi:hypothetical protein
VQPGQATEFGVVGAEQAPAHFGRRPLDFVDAIHSAEQEISQPGRRVAAHVQVLEQVAALQWATRCGLRQRREDRLVRGQMQGVCVGVLLRQDEFPDAFQRERKAIIRLRRRHRNLPHSFVENFLRSW